MEITNPISQQIWEDRYQHNGETLEENFKRVADFLGNTEEERKDFFNVMNKGYFFPAGRVMCNAGLGDGVTLNNCFVLGSVPDSMDEIFETAKIGAVTQKAGGGTGYDFSLIRPNGSSANHGNAKASGPVSFMSVFNQATATIMASGRRGANLGVLNVYHPDIYEYLEAKAKDANTLQHFNISVMVDDEFMRAVEKDRDIELHYPVYDDHWNIEKDRYKWTHRKRVRAKELWEEIVKQSYNTGEPGILFYDNLNRKNNTKYCETIMCLNPCSEFTSGTVYTDEEVKDWKGACNLGSLMLPSFVCFEDSNPKVDWYQLMHTTELAVHMLDNVIDKNYYPHKDYEDYQKNMRTIGLGITGLADMLILLGLKYGEPDAVKFTEFLINFIVYHAYNASANLAKDKGAFPMYSEQFAESVFIEEQKDFFSEIFFCDLHEDTYFYGDYSDVAPQWLNLRHKIQHTGIRNARLMSVAPTGTMSLTFGNNCSSGLEPIFMLEQQRYVKMHGQNDENKVLVSLQNPVWKAFKEDKLPPHVTEDLFVTALELPVDKHIDMLAAVAKHVDMSCSKTINIPEDYSFEDTKEVYMRCWREGVKGCTIFRPNKLREGIFVVDKKEIQDQVGPITIPDSLPRGAIVQVDNNVIGRERHLRTGCGTLHFQAYFDPATGDLVETYASRGSQGGCNSYMVALSRMVSLAARAGTPVDAIIDQLLSAPPCIAYNNRMRDHHDTSKGMSCAAAMGYALREMAEEMKVDDEEVEEIPPFIWLEPSKVESEVEVATTCPECGDTLTFEGGCNVCKSCGWSKCG